MYGVCLSYVHPFINKTSIMVRAATALFFISIFNITARAQTNKLDKNYILDLFQNQQYSEAINYLAPTAAMDSTNIQLLGYLGYAYYMEDNFNSAEQYFLHIVRIDSNNINANQYLARIHAEKDLESAIMFTRRLIILQSQKAIHYRNLGELFREQINGTPACCIATSLTSCRRRITKT